MSQLFDITSLRDLVPATVCIGSHPGIIQAMLDYDFLIGKAEPSVIAIIANGRSVERYYFGGREVVIPVYASAAGLPAALGQRANLLLNVASGRRVLANTSEAMQALPNLVGGSVFAEGVPERHAIELQSLAAERGVWLSGPASVGVIVPGAFKLSAIGGIEARQLQLSRLLTGGSVAVISSSGGMVNELIRSVANSGHTVSFAVAVGGERFPMLTPEALLLAAEADPQTTSIVYFGELGGQDEYAVAELARSGRLTKPVIAYIAGSVADLFAVPPQFGHAKAMASQHSESAAAKTAALQAAGINACQTYEGFITAMQTLPDQQPAEPAVSSDLARPRAGLFVNGISRDVDNDVHILGQELLSFAEQHSFASIVMSMILGRQIQSVQLEAFVDFTLRLLVDHGPYVSGAVNTMITARAGRDLESALASGLLTVGPRFGGAINQAAATWFDGVARAVEPADLVEELAARKQYISGIGHRKYRLPDRPDPRVGKLLSFSEGLAGRQYTDFALGVERETTAKKANLILNVDGAIAAVMLDLLVESEGLGESDVKQFIEVEGFNALFVLSRSVGFMAHYFDQRRHDEGLFRLGPGDITPL